MLFKLICSSVFVLGLSSAALAQNVTEERQRVRENLPSPTTIPPTQVDYDDPTVVRTQDRFRAPNAIDRPIREQLSEQRRQKQEAISQYREARRQGNAERIRERGQEMLTKQIELRQQALERINEVLTERCGLIVGAEMEAEIQEISAALESQKQAIATATNPEQIRALHRQIIESNRVFMIVSPAVRGYCLINRAQQRLSEIGVELFEQDQTQLLTELETLLEKFEQARAGFVTAVQERGNQATATQSLENSRRALADLRAAIEQFRQNVATALGE